MTSEEEIPGDEERRNIGVEDYLARTIRNMQMARDMGIIPEETPEEETSRLEEEIDDEVRILAEDDEDRPRTAYIPVSRTATGNTPDGNAEESIPATPDREMVLREGRAEDAEIPASQMVFHNSDELVSPFDPNMIVTLNLPTCRYCKQCRMGITIDESASGVEGGTHVCGECLIKGLDFIFGKKKIEEEEKMMEITDIELDSGEIFDGIMEDLLDE